MGLIGGLLGFAPMLALTVEVLVDPPGGGRPFALVPAAMSAAFLPAVWASVVRTGRRQTILRTSVAASLGLAFAGSFVFGLSALVLLAPATALLWLASGGARPGR